MAGSPDAPVLAAFLIGKPGAGKGTQGALLGRELGTELLSMGRLLREASDARAARGDRTVADAMRSGALVPADVSRAALLTGLSRIVDGRGSVVVEGVRRAVTLAAAIRQVRESTRVAGVLVDVPDDVVRRRLRARRQCVACQAAYGLLRLPPDSGRCECGGALGRRDDDRDESIDERLRVFEFEEREMQRIEGAKGFGRVDGDQSPKRVFEAIKVAFESQWASPQRGA